MGHDIVFYPNEFSVCPQKLRPVSNQYRTRKDVDIDVIDFFIAGNIGVYLAAQFSIADEFLTVQANAAR